MVDRSVFSLVPGDITELFRRLNGAPMYDILDTLDALLREKNFYPNSNRYQAELRAARIYVERMDAAMSAVLHKGGRNISLQKYQELHANKLSQLPEDQRRNIADYWKRGPSPGLLDGTAAVNPAIAKASFEKYVDLFTECIYDVNYKVTNSFSSILKAKYSDGTEIEIDFETEFSKHVLSAELARDSIAQGTVGRGGRIFPTLLTARTVPRLWAAMQEALVVQDEAFRDFAKLAVTGVMFALSVPAMPAGLAPGVGAGGSGLRATRRAIPRTGPPSAVAAAELKAIEALRAANPQLRNLTNEELLAIRSYTGEGWAQINAALRGAGNSSATTSAMSRSMLAGMSKLPGFSGRVVRSESMALSEATKKYVAGKPFSPDGFFSTSRAGAVAQREGNIAITVQAIGKQGKDISTISRHAGKEFEVLFPPGSKFVVEKTTEIGQALVVVLREL